MLFCFFVFLILIETANPINVFKTELFSPAERPGNLAGTSQWPRTWGYAPSVPKHSLQQEMPHFKCGLLWSSTMVKNSRPTQLKSSFMWNGAEEKSETGHRLSSQGETFIWDTVAPISSEKQTQGWLSSFSSFSFTTVSNNVSTGKLYGLHFLLKTLTSRLLGSFSSGGERGDRRGETIKNPSKYHTCLFRMQREQGPFAGSYNTEMMQI